MKAVADQVSVAMIRMRDEEAVRAARDELEERVEGEDRRSFSRRTTSSCANPRNGSKARSSSARHRRWRPSAPSRRHRPRLQQHPGCHHRLYRADTGPLPKESREHSHAKKVLEASIAAATSSGRCSCLADRPRRRRNPCG